MSKYSQDVVRMLYENQPNYISGQFIADQLNISRAGVKKIIDQLKNDGCDIESVNHKGHQLNAVPDQWYSGIVQPIVKDFDSIDQIEVYNSVDSTQTKAKKALVGNKSSFLILSDEQTEGRGRFNRNWSSSKGKGLWMSLVLRPNVPFAMIPKFNLFIALGIRDAIQQFSNDRVAIKWPNDIYIGKKKICGFLTEMVANYDAIEAIICGIGINMNHVEDDFNDEIRHIATSMRLHADDKINRYDFLKILLYEINKRYKQFLEQPFEKIREEYIAATNMWNRQLRFTENGHQFIGEAFDIDQDGFLLVKDDEGNLHRLMSADIDL